MADAPRFDPTAFQEFEHQCWTLVAQTYGDSFARLTCQAVEDTLDAVDVAAGRRVLDVACGPGYLAAAAAGRGAEAHGLDFVQEMVELARKSHPTATFHQGDAQDLPWEDGSFDAVVCGFGMLHFPHPERAIAEAFRVLRSGGRYAFTAWRPPAQSPLMGLIYGSFQGNVEFAEPVPAGPDIYRYGQEECCRETLQAAGFMGAEMRELPIVARFDEPGGVMQLIFGGSARTSGALRRLTQASRQRIIQAITDGARAFEGDDGVSIPVPAMLAVGCKP